MDGRDRRQYPRLEGHFQVDILNLGDDPNLSPWEAVVEGEALDVSMRGMRIKSFYNVAIGSNLSAIIYYCGEESICLCEVVWKRDVMGEFVYGLYFKQWSKLSSYLQKQLETMETSTLS